VPAKVKLNVTEGPAQGARFEFSEHDTFIVGRKKGCHVQLPNDGRISRHQCILEVNPPDARLRDLGSRNGTYVNGVKYGGRGADELPEQAIDRSYPQVDLHHGDTIAIGNTVVLVNIEIPAQCQECGCERAGLENDGGPLWCDACRRLRPTVPRVPMKPKPAPPPVCQECGKDVLAEIGTGRRGDYVCESCRQRLASDPKQLMKKLMQQAAKDLPAAQQPDIEGFQIQDKLGEGGMGAVYRARRNSDGREVAVKIMLARIAVSDKARQTFLREIEMIKSLQHPNIVRFDETGASGGVFFFVMELCNGGSLKDLLKEQGVQNIKALGPLMLRVLEGLAYAHGRGLVHRDLKPENILLHREGGHVIAKVSDFGLAKNFQKAGLSGMTATGSYSGTFPYMPREQLTNYKYVDPASDVFSMAATFYTALCGKWPRDMPRGGEPMDVILNCEATPLLQRNANVPRKVAAVIDRCLQMEPSSRYPTAKEMAADLRRAFSAEGVL